MPDGPVTRQLTVNVWPEATVEGVSKNTILIASLDDVSGGFGVSEGVAVMVGVVE